MELCLHSTLTPFYSGPEVNLFFCRVIRYIEENVFEKLIVAQLVKIFLAFMKPEGSSPCSEYPAAGSRPEPVWPLSHPIKAQYAMKSSVSFRLVMSDVSGIYISRIDPADRPRKHNCTHFDVIFPSMSRSPN